ncbi:MAG: hypothetical protein ACW97X_10450, partial [Candidatus Hodarchaeales archaeon]
LTSIGDVVVDSGVNEEGIISDYQNGIYRKLFFRENNLQGAILIGTKKSVHKLKTLTIRHAPYDEVSSELGL